jgi:hypothetical protein
MSAASITPSPRTHRWPERWVHSARPGGDGGHGRPGPPAQPFPLPGETLPQPGRAVDRSTDGRLELAALLDNLGIDGPEPGRKVRQRRPPGPVRPAGKATPVVTGRPAACPRSPTLRPTRRRNDLPARP